MEEKEERFARAISASARRDILRLLHEKEFTVKDISAKLNLSMSLTSRHLQLLHDLGFIKVRREAVFKYYSLRFKEARELIDAYDKILNKYNP